MRVGDINIESAQLSSAHLVCEQIAITSHMHVSPISSLVSDVSMPRQRIHTEHEYSSSAQLGGRYSPAPPASYLLPVVDENRYVCGRAALHTKAEYKRKTRRQNNP